MVNTLKDDELELPQSEEEIIRDMNFNSNDVINSEEVRNAREPEEEQEDADSLMPNTVEHEMRIERLEGDMKRSVNTPFTLMPMTDDDEKDRRKELSVLLAMYQLVSNFIHFSPSLSGLRFPIFIRFYFL